MKIKLSCVFCCYFQNLAKDFENVFEQLLCRNVFFVFNIGNSGSVKNSNRFGKDLFPRYKSILVLKSCVVTFLYDMKIFLSSAASFRLLDSHALLPYNF